MSGPESAPAPRWARLGALPVAAAVLTAINGVYLLLVAIGNITDYATNQAFVRHVLAMDTTNFGGAPGVGLDSDVMWRAITNSTLQDAAYIAIIAWETATALVLLGSLFFWLRERGAGYRLARSTSSIGLVMMLLLFMGGFIAIGGEWFQMWRSTAWNGLDAAFRNSALALVVLVLIHLPSEQWNEQGVRS